MQKKTVNLTIKTPLSIREKVYNTLRDDILDGRISPGERLIENRIALEIKTSRTPVREALHTLEREGLVESIPRVGYRVKEIKWDEVEEICEIRIVNETLAANWAIDRIKPREIKALENNLDSAKKETKKGNPKSFVGYDAEFHEILAKASGSQRLIELCQLLRRHMLRYRMQSLYTQDSALRAIKEHHHILTQIKKMDKRGVESAIREHLQWAKSDIKEKAFNKKLEKS